MTYKKRILFVGEASFLNTGFSNLYADLLPRLVATNKYELAELGSYARPDDPRIASFIAGRWKFYGTMPRTQEEAMAFNQPSQHPRDRGQNINQFGAGAFDKAVAEFKPDIVFSIRDNWMDTWVNRSLFRQWFKFGWQPTVDAAPQLEEWIQDYESCNIITGYSDFGIHTLMQQSSILPNGKRKMKIFPKPLRPGIDLDMFKPMDKKEIRDIWNLNKNVPIIGVTMRNQSRKLYPDLIDAFARMKNKYKGVKEVDDAVLAIHSCWPDNIYSFDYPRHIYRLETMPWLDNYCKGIRGSVLNTLFCYSCKQSSWTFAMNLYNKPIQEGRIKVPCPRCGQVNASPPNTNIGFDRKQMAEFYNLLDLYVQCSICEGEGMPCNEAKACGIPVMATDYSAMSEKVRFPSEFIHFKELNIKEQDYTMHLGGLPIEIERFYYEPETSCRRALPNTHDMADKMKDLICNPDKLSKMSKDARLSAESNYNGAEIAKQWEYILDNIQIFNRDETWNSPIEVSADIQPAQAPTNLSDEQFVEWLYLNILKYPTVDTNGAQMWIEHLKHGITREQLMAQFVSLGNQQVNQTKARDMLRSQIDNIPVKISNKQEFI
jgi:glycosyltransferase involved in cell wall biosynthesis